MTHVSKKHRHEGIENVSYVNEVEYNSINIESVTEMPMSNGCRNEAEQDRDILNCITNICMKLECKYRCSQIALNELVDGLSDVVDLTNDRNKTLIHHHLQSLQTQYRRK